MVAGALDCGGRRFGREINWWWWPPRFGSALHTNDVMLGRLLRSHRILLPAVVDGGDERL
jgi:hypothetical protein